MESVPWQGILITFAISSLNCFSVPNFFSCLFCVYIQTVSNYGTRLSKIIDLRDTDKSRYCGITEFNNCFIIRSLSLFFNKIIMSSESGYRALPSRSSGRDHINEQGASIVSFTHQQNSICSQKQAKNS